MSAVDSGLLAGLVVAVAALFGLALAYGRSRAAEAAARAEATAETARLRLELERAEAGAAAAEDALAGEEAARRSLAEALGVAEERAAAAAAAGTEAAAAAAREAAQRSRLEARLASGADPRVSSALLGLGYLRRVRAAGAWGAGAAGRAAAPPTSVAALLVAAIEAQLDALREEVGTPGDLVADLGSLEGLRAPVALLALEALSELLDHAARLADGVTVTLDLDSHALETAVDLEGASAERVGAIAEELAGLLDPAAGTISVDERPGVVRVRLGLRTGVPGLTDQAAGGEGDEGAAGPAEDAAAGPAEDAAVGPAEDAAAGPADDAATGPADDAAAEPGG